MPLLEARGAMRSVEAGPVGRGDVPGLERQLGFWVDRMRANVGKLPPECASRWVLLSGGQAHLPLEDGSSNPGPRESATTEEPIWVQEAQDETQREMVVKEDATAAAETSGGTRAAAAATS